MSARDIRHFVRSRSFSHLPSNEHSSSAATIASTFMATSASSKQLVQSSDDDGDFGVQSEDDENEVYDGDGEQEFPTSALAGNVPSSNPQSAVATAPPSAQFTSQLLSTFRGLKDVSRSFQSTPPADESSCASLPSTSAAAKPTNQSSADAAAAAAAVDTKNFFLQPAFLPSSALPSFLSNGTISGRTTKS
jgi:hypothetical protein